jgi:hypothetical protein
MQYLLLTYGNHNPLPKGTTAQQVHGAYMAYVEAMKSAGVFVDNRGLRPPSEAATVRAPDGKQSVVNGPFAESREQLGGYFLIEVPDMEAALAWAARCPAAQHGAVEVRPVWT